ncbi:MAG: aminoacyl-histidine dipeptidase [Oscillospiraceae bacterium]|nr:aminoacyl-histidine dipeptidase [Oscillospiraceae bacterium]
MEKQVLSALEPKSVFHFFEELSRIPRESGNMEAVSDWAVDFAKERGLRRCQDTLGNVIIWKDASPGYEDHPAVILQGHLDMVCVQEPGSEHDFEKDPLDLYIDGDWVKARGTTLGGDNGIAVAMILALLDDSTLAHPPIEAVFTVDEEVGLLGAKELDCSQLSGRKLINIDSEEEGVITAGCAGGARCDLKLSLPVERKSGIICEVLVSGLPGGHSGAEIHKNYANANRLLAQSLLDVPGLRLVSLEGGKQDNAIPNSARAVVHLPRETSNNVAMQIYAAFDAANAPFNTPDNAEPTCGVSFEYPHILPESLSPEDSRKVLELILAAPNGVQAMSQDIPGLVQTSLNLGILRLEGGKLRLSWSVRSSVAAEKEELIGALQALAERNGGSFDRRGDYPAWEFRKDSPLRKTMVQVFRELSGGEPKVEAIHAGLECGLFAGKLEGLDAVSIGPDMRDIHSPREKLSVSSVGRTWAYLTAVLARL